MKRAVYVLCVMTREKQNCIYYMCKLGRKNKLKAIIEFSVYFKNLTAY